MALLLPLTLLALAGAPLAPPFVQGVAKNGAALVVVSSASSATSAQATAAIDITLPDGMGDDAGAAVLPGLATAAAAVAGKDGRVEVSWRPGHLGLVVIAPATTPDVVVRAVDAALKAARTPPPKTPPKTPTTPPKTPPPALVVRGSPLLVPAADGVAARVALTGIGAAHVAVVVIAPGPAPELLRRAQALVATPLTKNAVATPRAPEIVDVTPAEHLQLPGGNTPAIRAALEVVADIVGGHVHGAGLDASLGFSGPGDALRAQLTALRQSPPPEALVDDVARGRRLALAAPLRDAATVAETLARDLAAGDVSATFVVIDALDTVDSAAVADAARLLLEVKP